MEIALTPQIQLPTQQTAPTYGAENSAAATLTKAASVQPIKKSDQDALQNNTSQRGDREAAVQKAAEMFRDFFPISDVSFSIYKDSTGQYITRFTNLRDGKVTYIPEQDMASFINRAGRSYNNITINA